MSADSRSKSPKKKGKAHEEGKLKEFLIDLVDAPSKNVVGLMDDWLRFLRYRNLLVIHDKILGLHTKRQVEGKTKPLPPKYALPLLEACSLEDEPLLQDLWAQLIANATNPEFEEQYHPSYVEIVKQLSADEALLLERLARIDSYPILFSGTTFTRADWASGELSRDESAVLIEFGEFVGQQGLKKPERSMAYLNNLERLKLLEFGRDFTQSLKDDPMHSLLPDDGEFGPFRRRLSEQLELEYSWNEEIRFSNYGQRFCEICFGESKA